MEGQTDTHEVGDPDTAEIWRAILRPGAADDEQFLNQYYNWRRPVSIQGLLGQPRFWMSWAYKAAYPKLAAFLEKASLDSKFRAKVLLEDIEPSEGQVQHRRFHFNEAHAALSVIFDALKTYPTQMDAATPTSENFGNVTHIKRFARTLHITDISPVVLSCVFGTSSSIDVSHIAAFANRHLNGCNWGKVNLVQLQNLGWSSFTYEYHFSFYYVTLDYADPDTIKPDPRKVRRTCSFGQGKNAKHRYIHEETASFLLCGHFDNAFNCVQLGDAYYKPRYAKSAGPRVFRSYHPNQSPGQFLLYWIAMALFHARSRWENAIYSLESEIISPADVVFMEDRNDLMADDPQFSLSKTYFWALQTYKLFERTLDETITTWENFKQESLPKVRDGRISPSDWDAAVQSIDQAIEQLRDKLDRVRRNIQDVKDLRQGLQSTAAVFDSRTAVRQGDNIRLLTYITLLFLPLSFGTGIFGMQIIEPTPNAVRAFAITLPVITIVTSFLIFNLDAEMAVFNSMVRRVTFGLQRRMKHHFRKDWKETALALHLDHLVAEPPARKAAKQSSNWVYILFILETIAVGLPVSEVKAALDFYGLFRPREEFDWDDNSSGHSNIDTEFRNRLRKEIRRRVRQAEQQAKEKEQIRLESEKGITRALLNRFLKSVVRLARLIGLAFFAFARALLLPIWIVLLALEYLLVVAYLSLKNRSTARTKSPTHKKETRSESENKSPFLRAWSMLGLDSITFPKRHDREYLPRSSDEFALEGLPNRISESKSPGRGKEVLGSPTSPASNANDRDQGRHGANVELSTFAAEPQSDTVRRVTRAANSARHGSGYIPGDIERAESQS